MLVVGGPLDASEHHRAGHPERPSRVHAAMAGVKDLAAGDDVEQVIGEPASFEQLCLVHGPDYLRALEALCEAGGGDLDPDTYATAYSFDAARLAVGTGLAVIERLQHRGAGVAFVAARPPGHHARPDRAMGFCLLNSIAVAAARLAAEGERVLIVDWDVHHGNGTQEIFWDHPSVLYVSTHQSPLYPGTGAATEVGGPGAPGLTVNIPLPPGTDGDLLRRALIDVAGPVIDAFTPTWVLVSAGFDAHRDDPLANFALSSGDFARLARTVQEFTPGPGRLALFLEGGYDLAAIRASVAATLGQLLDAPTPSEPPAGQPVRGKVVEQLKSQRIAALRRAGFPAAEG
jgi:acetoin utilization deacetylase AcuC-like enzyme